MDSNLSPELTKSIKAAAHDVGSEIAAYALTTYLEVMHDDRATHNSPDPFDYFIQECADIDDSRRQYTEFSLFVNELLHHVPEQDIDDVWCVYDDALTEAFYEVWHARNG